MDPMHRRIAADRRLERTRGLLRTALGALIRERPYDDIAVKEILGRANVGRSAFYAHFAGKDELLRSCIEQILRSEGAGGRGARGDLLWFSLPLFRHIETNHVPGHGGGGPRDQRRLHEHLERAIAELILEDLRATVRMASPAMVEATAPLLARWVAATLVLVLEWWAEGGFALPAAEVNRVFRRLVEPGAGGVG